MAETTKNILFVTSNSQSIIIRSLEKELEQKGIQTWSVAPNVTEISKMKDVPRIFVLQAQEYVENNSDVLMFIKDYCAENGNKIIFIGYSDEIEKLKNNVAASLIIGEFLRPIEVKELAVSIVECFSQLSVVDEKKHILVVDDSGMMLRTIKSWLDSDYKVSVCNSAAHAFTFINKTRPDLILLDYEMPICSGAQFLEMLRSETETEDLPVIFLTSLGDPESVKNVIALKPQGYLLKSTPKEKVLEAIKDFFEKEKAKML